MLPKKVDFCLDRHHLCSIKIDFFLILWVGTALLNRSFSQSAITVASKLAKVRNNFLKTCLVLLEFKPYSSSILCTALFPSLHAVLFLGVFHSWESSLPPLEITGCCWGFFFLLLLFCFLQQWRKAARVVLLLHLWHQATRRQSGICEHLLLQDAVTLTSRMSCLRMGVKLNNIFFSTAFSLLLFCDLEKVAMKYSALSVSKTIWKNWVNTSLFLLFQARLL